MTKAREICCDEVKKETDAAWTDIIVKGKNKMPSYDKKVTGAATMTRFISLFLE